MPLLLLTAINELCFDTFYTSSLADIFNNRTFSWFRELILLLLANLTQTLTSHQAQKFIWHYILSKYLEWAFLDPDFALFFPSFPCTIMHTVESRFKSMSSLRAMWIMTWYAPNNDTLGGKFQHFAASFRQAEKLGPVKTMAWQHRTPGRREGSYIGAWIFRFPTQHQQKQDLCRPLHWRLCIW